MIVIQNAQLWASSQGYSLLPSYNKSFLVSRSGAPVGALLPIPKGYKFVSCDTPSFRASQESSMCSDVPLIEIPETFQSRSFGLSDLLPYSLEREKKNSKEIILPEQVAGTGVSERISDCNYWLPYAAEHYCLSRDIRDYVLVPIPAIFSDLPNTNGDGLSLKQMLRFDPEFGMQMYKTFKGKPTHLEHCFPASAPVLTDRGYKPIKKVRLGDRVWTHEGRFKEVTELFANGKKAVSRIICQGMGGEMLTTKNHPFYVVDKRQVYGKFDVEKQQRNHKLRREQVDIQPHFRPVTDVYTGDYLVVPINIGGDIKVDQAFAFLTGLYAAEGSFEKHNSERVATILTLGFHEDELLEEALGCLDDLGLDYSVYGRPKTGVSTIRIKGRHFANQMYRLVGEYSYRKHCRNELRQWDNEALKNFLGGYASGDGHVGRGARRLRCVTVSKQLAYDVQNIFARLGAPASITRNDSGTMVSPSSGKEYNRRVSYQIGVSANVAAWMADYIVGKDALEVFSRKQTSRLIVVGDFLLAPVIKIEHDVHEEEVFNLEVSDDHSYTAYNVLVHNCNKDITQAKGVILDSFLRPVPFNRKYYKIVLLLAYDRTKDSMLAESILRNESNAYSVGFYYKSYSCSVCGTRVGRGINLSPCSHTQMGKPTYQQADGKIVYRKCEDGIGFECSSVNTPAFVSAIGPTVYDARNF